MRKAIIIFVVLILLIISPLIKGPYFFLLDYTPRLNEVRTNEIIYGIVDPIYGGNVFFQPIYSIFTHEILNILFLSFILFISALSAYQLVPVSSKPAKLFAGILYMLNPYTYIRILTGQWFVLFSYAMLPLALKSFIEFLEKKERKKMVEFVFLLTLIGFNAHMLAIALLAMIIIFSFWLGRRRDTEAAKGVVIASILFILLNAYWLIPLATAKDTLISSFGNQDLEAFAPRIESISSLFTLASMYGFWRAGYIYAKSFLPFWQVLFILILFLAVHGFTSYYRDKKIEIYVKSFAATAIIGLILAAGIGGPFSEIFRWLFDHIPLIKGMRDSHKFVTLLVLAYAYLGALGVENISTKIKMWNGKTNHTAIIVVAIALAIPLIYSFTFFNGFAGQIKSSDYPKDWYEINEFLNSDEQDFKVLFFPWHQYMSFHWVSNEDKRIANPAQHFFDKGVISGINVEMGGIYRQLYSSDQLYIDFLLQEKENVTSFGNLIAPLNIKYVLLTKEIDYKKYFFLFNQSDLELVKETENFYVFKNKHEVAKIYEVDSINYIRDWKELLEKSKKEDLTSRVYLIGNPLANVQEDSEKKSLEYEKKNPVSYEIREKTSKKILIFTEPYSDNWELNGKRPIAAYGVVNAYEVTGENSKKIEFERFYKIYVPSYIISVLVFIVLIVSFRLQKNHEPPDKKN